MGWPEFDIDNPVCPHCGGWDSEAEAAQDRRKLGRMLGRAPYLCVVGPIANGGTKWFSDTHWLVPAVRDDVARYLDWWNLDPENWNLDPVTVRFDVDDHGAIHPSGVAGPAPSIIEGLLKPLEDSVTLQRFRLGVSHRPVCILEDEMYRVVFEREDGVHVWLDQEYLEFVEAEKPGQIFTVHQDKANPLGPVQFFVGDEVAGVLMPVRLS